MGSRNYKSVFENAGSYGTRESSSRWRSNSESSLGSDILTFTDLEQELEDQKRNEEDEQGQNRHRHMTEQTHDRQDVQTQDGQISNPTVRKDSEDDEVTSAETEDDPPKKAHGGSKLLGLVGDVLRITGSEDLHQHSDDQQIEQEILKMVEDDNRGKDTATQESSSTASQETATPSEPTYGAEDQTNVSIGKRLWRKVNILVGSGMLVDSESDSDVSETEGKGIEERRDRTKTSVTPAANKNYLRLAVSNDSPMLVLKLLERSSALNIYNALMASISLGRDHITMMFLEHAKFEVIHQMTKLMQTGTLHTLTSTSQREQADDSDLHEDGNHDDVLSSDITPLMLAAQHNQFDVVKALLDKGERIETPHLLGCNCDVCKQHPDELRQAKTRLNAYRAIVSDSYVVLANLDPILVSFQLCQKLRKLATEEKHYKAEYLQLADQCGQLPRKLLDKVRDGDELDILLDEKSGSGLNAYDYLARLKLAIDKQQKPFVAHPSCQKQLASLWIGFIDPAVVEKSWKAMIFFLGLAVAYPFLVLIYWIHPRHKIGRFLNIPMIKFGAATCSYVVFICLVIGYSATETPTSGWQLSTHPRVGPNYRNYTSTVNPVKDSFLRQDKIGIGTILLCLWLLGLIWEDLKQLIRERSTYFNSINNIVDLTMLSLFFISFALRFAVVVLVRDAVTYFENYGSWSALAASNTSKAMDKLIWLDADRSSWKTWDLFILSEAIFSVASVLSITRLTYVFTVSERLGPLLISLAKMIEDMFAFMVLFVFIIGAFVIGFHNLYWYSYDSSQQKLEIPKDDRFATAFKSFADVVHSCFWSIFGLVDLDNKPFGPDNLGHITAITGHVIFAFYDWLMVIILINMLIAMMSRTYGVIAAQEDIEWKFARTKLYMDYIRAGSTLPTPFNLVPTWKSVFLLGRTLADGCCRRCAGRPIKIRERAGAWDLQTGRRPTLTQLGFKLTGNQQNRKHSTEEPPQSPGGKNPTAKYLEVVASVVKRFIQTYGKGHGTNATDDLDQLKKDMSSLRQEVMTVLNGQDTDRQELASSIQSLETNLAKSSAELGQQLAMTAEHQQEQAGLDRTQASGNIRQLAAALGEMREQFAQQLKEICLKVEGLEPKDSKNKKFGKKKS